MCIRDREEPEDFHAYTAAPQAEDAEDTADTDTHFAMPELSALQMCIRDRTTSGLILLSKAAAQPAQVNPCIRCGRCVEYCPCLLYTSLLGQRMKM